MGATAIKLSPSVTVWNSTFNKKKTNKKNLLTKSLLLGGRNTSEPFTLHVLVNG